MTNSVAARIEARFSHPRENRYASERIATFFSSFVPHPQAQAVLALVDALPTSTATGSFLLVTGPMGSGKTATLLERARHPEDRRGTEAQEMLPGDLLHLSGASTAKRTALRFYSRLSPTRGNPTQVPAGKAVNMAKKLLSTTPPSLVVLDDLDRILDAGTEDAARESLDAALADIVAESKRHVVICGREDTVRGSASAVLDKLPRLTSLLGRSLSIRAYAPDDPGLPSILSCFEAAAGFREAGFFGDTNNVARLSAAVPSGLIGHYADLFEALTVKAANAGIEALNETLLRSTLAELIADGGGAHFVEVFGGSRRRKPRAVPRAFVYEDTLISGHAAERFSMLDEGPRPRDLIWRIPVSAEISVPVVQKGTLRPIAERVISFDGGKRETTIWMHPDGRLFVEGANNVDLPSLKDLLRHEGEHMLDFADVPEAFEGFPWGLSTVDGVVAKLGREVSERLASKFRGFYVQDGNLFTPCNTPEWYAQAWRDGAMIGLELDMGEDWDDRVRAFDAVDMEEALAFASRLNLYRGLDEKVSFDQTTSFREIIAGSLPRDSFERFVRATAQLLVSAAAPHVDGLDADDLDRLKVCTALISGAPIPASGDLLNLIIGFGNAVERLHPHRLSSRIDGSSVVEMSALRIVVRMEAEALRLGADALMVPSLRLPRLERDDALTNLEVAPEDFQPCSLSREGEEIGSFRREGIQASVRLHDTPDAHRALAYLEVTFTGEIDGNRVADWRFYEAKLDERFRPVVGNSDNGYSRFASRYRELANWQAASGCRPSTFAEQEELVEPSLTSYVETSRVVEQMLRAKARQLLHAIQFWQVSHREREEAVELKRTLEVRRAALKASLPARSAAKREYREPWERIDTALGVLRVCASLPDCFIVEPSRAASSRDPIGELVVEQDHIGVFADGRIVGRHRFHGVDDATGRNVIALATSRYRERRPHAFTEVELMEVDAELERVEVRLPSLLKAEEGDVERIDRLRQQIRRGYGAMVSRGENPRVHVPSVPMAAQR